MKRAGGCSIITLSRTYFVKFLIEEQCEKLLDVLAIAIYVPWSYICYIISF